ncbi:glycosyltransferase family 39 protein [Tunturiibacter empetritectus]|uniref:ArnT family glycosyltransferase n=1 Tax=Tunturiibacter empetritectus TaxID=3069691 RepID=UPI003D9B8EC7
MQNQLKLDEETPVHETSPQNATSRRPWNPVSLAVIFFLWLILQIGGLFTPGLLDDVDSIYIEIAREMLQRHDYVTPYIDGVRFFDKPPLMYWMAAGSMRLFGIHDWAARLPLALAVLVLLLAVYALGIRLFATVSPAEKPDRGAFYAAIALATSIGPYLYTRFYIPDILIALWMTLAVHLFLIALDRLRSQTKPQNRVPHSSQSHRDQWVIARQRDPLSSPSHESPGAPSFAHFAKGGNVSSSALLPCLAFAAVMALNVLTKGLIGLVFPIAFVLLYLAITRQLHLLPKLHLIPSTLVFLAIAAPWHILAALRNPAISMPPGLGLPAKAGWAWFYLYNEHIARFLSKRIPHDYGQTPVLLFWIYLAIWIMPWTVFLPGAIADHIRTLRHRTSSIATSALPAHASTKHRSAFFSGASSSWASSPSPAARSTTRSPRSPLCALWPAVSSLEPTSLKVSPPPNSKQPAAPSAGISASSSPSPPPSRWSAPTSHSPHRTPPPAPT